MKPLATPTPPEPPNPANRTTPHLDPRPFFIERRSTVRVRERSSKTPAQAEGVCCLE